MATAAILNLFNPQQLPHTTVDIPTKFHEIWRKESNFFLDPSFFVSMATAEKFVQPIPIFLAHLVVPIKIPYFSLVLFYAISFNNGCHRGYKGIFSII